MDTISITCPHCGASFTCNTVANYCFCSTCGQRIEFVRVTSPDKTPPVETKAVPDEQECDEKLQKKEKRYKQAKFLGSAVVILAVILLLMDVIDSISLAFFCIVPFIENLFYPFHDDWSSGKRVWKWFIESIAMIFFWAVAIIVLVLLVSIISSAF